MVIAGARCGSWFLKNRLLYKHHMLLDVTCEYSCQVCDSSQCTIGLLSKWIQIEMISQFEGQSCWYLLNTLLKMCTSQYELEETGRVESRSWFRCDNSMVWYQETNSYLLVHCFLFFKTLKTWDKDKISIAATHCRRPRQCFAWRSNSRMTVSTWVSFKLMKACLCI